MMLNIYMMSYNREEWEKWDIVFQKLKKCFLCSVLLPESLPACSNV